MTGHITYLLQHHLITIQAEAEASFLKEFLEGVYTYDSPLVRLDLYKISPLTAALAFRTPIPAEVTLTILGKEPQGDIVHTFPRACDHILPVYGLYAGYENTVRISVSTGQRAEIRIKTAPLDPEVPIPTYCKTNHGHMGNNVIFLTQTSKARALACDYRGDIRWYLMVNACFDLKRLKNGHLLVGSSRLMFQPHYVSGVYEMGVNGKIYKEFRVPGSYHHDAFEMENGNLLLLSQTPNGTTLEDLLLLIDRETGAILKQWDYKKVLPYDVPSTYSGSGSARDWFHSNAVWYDSATDSIVISGRHQDAVVSLDFKTGALNWILTDPEGWPEEYRKYMFAPVGEGFEWPYEQHGIQVCPDGDILVFDNGHYRSKDKAHYLPPADSYSRGVRYHLDLEKMTIRQIWQFGKERGYNFYSPYISNVEYYDEGRYMVHSGGIAWLDGKPMSGLGCYEHNGPNHDRTILASVTCEIVDDEVVYELHVPSNTFRAEKLPMYYAGEQADLGPGKLLGSLCETEPFETAIPAHATGELIPEHYGASVTEEEDLIKFNATFEKGELAQLLLENVSGEIRRYYINTAASGSFDAICVGTFLKTDPRNVDVIVNKQGLSGQYNIRLVCDDKIFETGITISV